LAAELALLQRGESWGVHTASDVSRKAKVPRASLNSCIRGTGGRELLIVAGDGIPALIAGAAVPASPRGRIVREVLPRDIAQGLVHPGVGLRIQGGIVDEVE